MTTSTAARQPRLKLKKNTGDQLFSLALIAPTMLVTIVFILVPVIDSVIKSFTDYRIKNIISGAPGVWNNFENYIKLFQGGKLVPAITHTLLFVVGVVIAQFVLGMALAVILNSGMKGAREGGAFVSCEHANFIINGGSATAREVRALIAKLQAILGSRKLQMETIKTEMQQIKRTYKEARKTEVLGALENYEVPDESVAKPVEEIVITVNALGHLKKMPVKSFNLATKDFTDNSTKKEICSSIVKTDTEHRVYCFTDRGNCYKLDIESIPDGKWRDNGAPRDKIFKDAQEGERVLYMLPIEETLPGGSLLFYTRMGMVKRSDWKEFGVVKSAFQVCKVNDGDTIIGIEQYVEGSTLMFVTASGMCLNADMSDIPLQGRIAAGVKGIQLSDGDSCVMIKQITPDGEIIVLTNRGYGKRVLSASIDVMSRYRKGVKIIDFGKTNGTSIVFASYVKEPYKIVLEEEDHYLMAFSTEDISIENRTHAGRQLFKGKLDVTGAYIYNDGFVPGN